MTDLSRVDAMTNLSPAAQVYQTTYTAFDKIKNTFIRLLKDNRTIDDRTLDTYKEARNALIQAQNTLNAEQEALDD